MSDMSSMEPSPGPWMWVTEAGEVHLEDATGRVVLSARMLRDVGCRPHDESLIAAGPELLEALKAAVACVRTGYDPDPEVLEAWDALTKRIEGKP